MGNCIDRQSAVTWVDDYDDDDDDDDLVSASSEDDGRIGKVDDTKSSHSTEVKIKITKKQLEQLMKHVDGEDLTVQDVLTDLMGGGDDRHLIEDPDRHWKPVLQSIPEMSE